MKRGNPSAGPPPEFLDKMSRLLSPGDFAGLQTAFAQPARQGLRVNSLKISVSNFISMSPFRLEPLGDWEPAAFLVIDDSRPGRHVYHDAGLYYLQDPSAMVAAALLAPQPGERVLDLAAAPGGKATHLLSLLHGNTMNGSALRRSIHESSLLVANDVHAGRARVLADNLARWGAVNVLITQDEPERIAAALGPSFDRVLLDAPCSGEGMFRRGAPVEWSEAIVAACARRQDGILPAAAELVRPGGRLLYATCTYSPEENEQVIARFLARAPEYEMSEPVRFSGLKPGRPDWLDVAQPNREAMARAVRLWPHRFPGEGHFFALVQKLSGQTLYGGRVFKPYEPSRTQLSDWLAFRDIALNVDIPQPRLHVHNQQLYLLPAQAIDPGRIHLVRYGLALGEFRPGHFRPSYDLAVAMRLEDAQVALEWTPDDPRLVRYLAGEDVALDGPDGWCLVCVNGYGLGWAKRSHGRLKNHFPRRLRRS